jgi:hypothetical protein
MLKKTESELEQIFDTGIDLGTFYTFDNKWSFYKFKNIKEVRF